MPKPAKRPAPIRHRWLDQWLAADGEPLHRLVERTLQFVEHDEQHDNVRLRSRRQSDEAYHRQRIEVLVANLALAVLNPPESGRIAIRASQGSAGLTRYDNLALGPKPTRELLSRLEKLEFLDWQMPKAMRGERSSIAPTEWFRQKIDEFGVGLDDIGWRGGELILLNRNTQRRGSEWGSNEGTVGREPINYVDTSLTHRLRADMRRINEWLAQADVTFENDSQLPQVMLKQRQLRRYFLLLPDQREPRFDQSGRLFGGFWQTLKADRRKHIRIGGERVATLDYGSMFTRLAYASLGVDAPDGDVYALPGAEGYRSGVKMATNCLLFDTHVRRGWPKALGVGMGDDDAAVSSEAPAGDFEARLPEGWTVKRTKQGILERHPALAPVLGRGLGYALMNKESEVLLAVLNELMARGIVGLGLHDGVLVPSSRAEEAKDVMLTKATEIVGASIPVSLK